MKREDITKQFPDATKEQIDAIMVNTCGFIRDAKTESIEAIFAMSASKSSPSYSK